MGVEGLFPTEGRGGRGLFRPSLCGKCKRRPSPFLLLLLFLRSTEGRDKSDKSIKGSPKGGTKERGRDSSSFSFLRVTVCVCVKEAIIFRNYCTSPFPLGWDRPALGGSRRSQRLLLLHEQARRRSGGSGIGAAALRRRMEEPTGYIKKTTKNGLSIKFCLPGREKKGASLLCLLYTYQMKERAKKRCTTY